jgi:hypothetical protein
LTRIGKEEIARKKKATIRATSMKENKEKVK